MIELTEKSVVYGFWFVGCQGVDWLASLIREGDGPWTLSYRFRYHVDTKVFDSDDERRGYKVFTESREPEPPQPLLEAANKMAEMLARDWEAELEFVPVNGGSQAAIKALSKTTWASLKTVGPTN